jgi:DNA-directed RNA polymerase subunit K/omega
MASARAREISRLNKHSDKHEHLHTTITALQEFQDGKLGPDYMKRMKFEDSKYIDRSAKYLGR